MKGYSLLLLFGDEPYQYYLGVGSMFVILFLYLQMECFGGGKVIALSRRGHGPPHFKPDMPLVACGRSSFLLPVVTGLAGDWNQCLLAEP